MSDNSHRRVSAKVIALRTNMVAALASIAVACAGCASHQEVPPGGHRQWGACAAIGALTGAAIGAGLGMAISIPATDDQSSVAEAAIPGNPSQLGAAGGVTCPALGAFCPTASNSVVLVAHHHDDREWLGLLGAIPGTLAGALVGHYLCDPVVAAAEPLPPPPPPPVAEAPPPPLPVAAPPERIVLRGVHFAFNKYDIRPESEAVLEEAARVLKTHPSIRVDVNGYCDIIGSDAYNLVLSEKRANAVRNYLVQEGISPDRLVARGFGKTNFVASNDTDQGRAQNRRVELVPIQSSYRG